MFQPGDAQLCAGIAIISDALIGESREVFAVGISISMSAGLRVSTGPISEAIVVINDVPGMQEYHKFLSNQKKKNIVYYIQHLFLSFPNSLYTEDESVG